MAENWEIIEDKSSSDVELIDIEEGQKILGVVEKVTKAKKENKFGKISTLVYLTVEGESKLLIASRTKLVGLLEDANLQPGDKIEVAYLGKVTLDNGHTMADYELRVARGVAAVAAPSQGESDIF